MIRVVRNKTSVPEFEAIRVRKNFENGENNSVENGSHIIILSLSKSIFLNVHLYHLEHCIREPCCAVPLPSTGNHASVCMSTLLGCSCVSF